MLGDKKVTATKTNPILFHDTYLRYDENDIWINIRAESYSKENLVRVSTRLLHKFYQVSLAELTEQTESLVVTELISWTSFLWLHSSWIRSLNDVSLDVRRLATVLSLIQIGIRTTTIQL